jgi:hypothetical protein
MLILNHIKANQIELDKKLQPFAHCTQCHSQSSNIQEPPTHHSTTKYIKQMLPTINLTFKVET